MSGGSTHLAAVLHGKLDVRLEQLPIPEPGKHEVQVRVKKVGICDSDVHLWQDGGIADFFKLPMVLGHECSGVVTKIGEGVTKFKVGDRVSAEPLRPCLSCEFCQNGRCNVCSSMTVFFGPPPNNGAMCQYLKQDEQFVEKLPDNVSFEEGAMIEPLAVAVRACTRAGVKSGDTVLICGAGPIGLSIHMVAKAFGASSVIITDIVNSRLELAKQVGATNTLLVKSEDRPEDVSRKIVDILGCSPNKALECSGAEIAVNVCISALQSNGHLGLVGIGDPYMNISLQRVVLKELDVSGSLCYVKTFPVALDMVANGKVNILPLATHTFPLQKTTAAFEKALSRTGMKIMIDCNPE